MGQKFVYLVMPVFASNLDVEKTCVENITVWKEKFKKNVKKILGHEFQVDIATPKVNDPHEICETISTTYTNITKKGRMIRHELQRIRSLVNYSDIDNSYFVLLDGTGKIDFNSVYPMLNALETKQAVFGCRPYSQAISDNRVLFESFENYLVSQKYKAILPDAQCGCWGFNLNILKDVPLIAESYEIELDLIINVLERNMDMGFIEVKINDNENTKKTNYKFDSNLEKLNFLCHKLSLSKDVLLLHYSNFIQETKAKFPKKYIQQFDKISFPRQYYKKFDCVGACVKKCDRAIKQIF